MLPVDETVPHDHALTPLEAFLRGVHRQLGADAVAPDEAVRRASANVEGAGHRFAAVVRPRQVQEVQAVLRLATATGQPVRPWSRGCNWGYGTRTPVDARCVGLDLSALDAIRRMDETSGVVEIEPGVTQGQLADWLEAQGSAFYLDVTGSSRGTSVLGNALDRGIAYSSARAECIRHLEVVLADGRVLRTGMASWSTDIADRYRHGLGPDLTGLFVQSNLGVVTGCSMVLRRRPPCRLTLRAHLKDPRRLPAFIQAIGDLKRDLGLDSIVHVADGARASTTLAPLARQHAHAAGLDLTRDQAEALVRSIIGTGWAALGVIEGERSMVRAASREARRRLRPFGRLALLDRRRLGQLAGLAERVGANKRLAVARAAIEMSGLTAGVPTDGALHGIYWDHRDDEPSWRQPEHGQTGWLMINPLLPTEPRAIEQVLACLEAEAERAGCKLAVTLNVIGPQLVLAVASLTWPLADRAAGERALEAQRRLTAQLFEEGLVPYRVGTAEHPHIPWDEVHAGVLQALGRALDPAAVIAPGRYAPARVRGAQP